MGGGKSKAAKKHKNEAGSGRRSSIAEGKGCSYAFEALAVDGMIDTLDEAALRKRLATLL